MQLNQSTFRGHRRNQSIKNNRKIQKAICFYVRVAPINAYPDLNDNPNNPFIKLPPEERLKDLIETLGVIWAQTCKDDEEIRDRISWGKNGGKR